MADPQNKKKKDPEHIIICFDNSEAAPYGSVKFHDQCEAIESYCKMKFADNPDTLVNLYAMSSCYSRHLIHPPTSSITKIQHVLKHLYAWGGEVDLKRALSFGAVPFSVIPTQKDRKRRLVAFVGGYTNMGILFARKFGKEFREEGAVVDIVDFSSGEETSLHTTGRYKYGRSELQLLVKVCNGDKNLNRHFVDVGPKRSICTVLSNFMKKQLENENQVEASDAKNGNTTVCQAPLNYKQILLVNLNLDGQHKGKTKTGCVPP